MIVTKLVQIRLYADKPAETANFYATLGCEVSGPIELLDTPDDFPVYWIELPQGLDIAISQLSDGSDVNNSREKTLLAFQVEGYRAITERLMARGIYEPAKEPRVVAGAEGSWAVTDPDGRLVGLDGAALSRMTAFLEAKNWRATSPTRYCNGDFVRHDGILYECSVDHEAQEGSPPPAAPEVWDKVSWPTNRKG
jgi:hypothetical protein